MRDLRHILQDEFIGLKAKVVKCTNKSCVGLSGIIIDETKNTFKILCRDGSEKILIKENCIFHFTLPDKTVVEIEGRALIGRPEDRLKRAVRRRW